MSGFATKQLIRNLQLKMLVAQIKTKKHLVTMAFLAVFLFFTAALAFANTARAAVNDSCVHHEDCKDTANLVCESGQCKGVRDYGCSSNEQCSAGFVCTNGKCSQDFGKMHARALNLGDDVDDIYSTIQRIINIALAFLSVMGVVIMIYGGFVWMTARGNEEQVAKARKIIIAAAIGLLIIGISWTIASYLLTLGRKIGGEGGPRPEITPFPSSLARTLEPDPFQITEIVTAHPLSAKETQGAFNEYRNDYDVYTCSDISIELNHFIEEMDETAFNELLFGAGYGGIGAGFEIWRDLLSDETYLGGQRSDAVRKSRYHPNENPDAPKGGGAFWELWPNSINFNQNGNRFAITDPLEIGSPGAEYRKYFSQISTSFNDVKGKVLEGCREGLGGEPSDGVDGGCNTSDPAQITWALLDFHVHPDFDAGPPLPRVERAYPSGNPENPDRFIDLVPNLQMWFEVPIYQGSIMERDTFNIRNDNVKIFKILDQAQAGSAIYDRDKIITDSSRFVEPFFATIAGIGPDKLVAYNEIGIQGEDTLEVGVVIHNVTKDEIATIDTLDKDLNTFTVGVYDISAWAENDVIQLDINSGAHLLDRLWSARIDTYTYLGEQTTDLKFIYKDVKEPLEAFTWYGIVISGVENLCHEKMRDGTGQGGQDDRFVTKFRTSNVGPGISYKYPSPGSFYSCPDTEVFVKFKTSMYDITTGLCKIAADDTTGFVESGTLKDQDESQYRNNIQVQDDVPDGEPTSRYCTKYGYNPTTEFLAPLGTQDNRDINGNPSSFPAYEPYKAEFFTRLKVEDISDKDEPVKNLGDRANQDSPPWEGEREGVWEFSTLPFGQCVYGPYIDEISPPFGDVEQCVSLIGNHFDDGAGTHSEPENDDRVDTGLYFSVDDLNPAKSEFITNLTSNENDFYNGLQIIFPDLGKEGKTGIIRDYIGSDKKVILTEELSETPNPDEKFYFGGSLYSNNLEDHEDDLKTDRWRSNVIILHSTDDAWDKDNARKTISELDKIDFSVAINKSFYDPLRGTEEIINIPSNNAFYTYTNVGNLNSPICLYDLIPSANEVGRDISAAGSKFVIDDGEGEAEKLLDKIQFTPEVPQNEVQESEMALSTSQPFKGDQIVTGITVPALAQTGNVTAIDTDAFRSNSLPFEVRGSNVVFNQCGISAGDFLSALVVFDGENTAKIFKTSLPKDGIYNDSVIIFPKRSGQKHIIESSEAVNGAVIVTLDGEVTDHLGAPAIPEGGEKIEIVLNQNPGQGIVDVDITSPPPAGMGVCLGNNTVPEAHKIISAQRPKILKIDSESEIDDFYKGMKVVFAIFNQERIITNYNGGTREITINEAVQDENGADIDFSAEIPDDNITIKLNAPPKINIQIELHGSSFKDCTGDEHKGDTSQEIKACLEDYIDCNGEPGVTLACFSLEDCGDGASGSCIAAEGLTGAEASARIPQARPDNLLVILNGIEIGGARGSGAEKTKTWFKAGVKKEIGIDFDHFWLFETAHQIIDRCEPSYVGIDYSKNPIASENDTTIATAKPYDKLCMPLDPSKFAWQWTSDQDGSDNGLMDLEYLNDWKAGKLVSDATYNACRPFIRFKDGENVLNIKTLRKGESADIEIEMEDYKPVIIWWDNSDSILVDRGGPVLNGSAIEDLAEGANIITITGAEPDETQTIHIQLKDSSDEHSILSMIIKHENEFDWQNKVYNEQIERFYDQRHIQTLCANPDVQGGGTVNVSSATRDTLEPSGGSAPLDINYYGFGIFNRACVPGESQSSPVPMSGESVDCDTFKVQVLLNREIANPAVFNGAGKQDNFRICKADKNDHFVCAFGETNLNVDSENDIAVSTEPYIDPFTGDIKNRTLIEWNPLVAGENRLKVSGASDINPQAYLVVIPRKKEIVDKEHGEMIDRISWWFEITSSQECVLSNFKLKSPHDDPHRMDVYHASEEKDDVLGGNVTFFKAMPQNSQCLEIAGKKEKEIERTWKIVKDKDTLLMIEPTLEQFLVFGWWTAHPFTQYAYLGMNMYRLFKSSEHNPPQEHSGIYLKSKNSNIRIDNSIIETYVSVSAKEPENIHEFGPDQSELSEAEFVTKLVPQDKDYYKGMAITYPADAGETRTIINSQTVSAISSAAYARITINDDFFGDYLPQVGDKFFFENDLALYSVRVAFPYIPASTRSFETDLDPTDIKDKDFYKRKKITPAKTITASETAGDNTKITISPALLDLPREGDIFYIQGDPGHVPHYIKTAGDKSTFETDLPLENNNYYKDKAIAPAREDKIILASYAVGGKTKLKIAEGFTSEPKINETFTLDVAAKPRQVIIGCTEDSECVSGYCTADDAICVGGQCMPVIVGISPSQGASQTWVSIKGCNFGDGPGANGKVTFGAAQANIAGRPPEGQYPECRDGWEDSIILAEAPDSADQTVRVSIISAAGAEAVRTRDFTYEAGNIHHGICQAEPDPAKTGRPVTVHGKDLGFLGEDWGITKHVFYGAEKPSAYLACDPDLPAPTPPLGAPVCSIFPPSGAPAGARVDVRVESDTYKKSNDLPLFIAEPGLEVSYSAPKKTSVCLTDRVSAVFNGLVRVPGFTQEFPDIANPEELKKAIQLYKQENKLLNSDFNESDGGAPYAWALAGAPADVTHTEIALSEGNNARKVEIADSGNYVVLEQDKRNIPNGILFTFAIDIDVKQGILNKLWVYFKNAGGFVVGTYSKALDAGAGSYHSEITVATTDVAQKIEIGLETEGKTEVWLDNAGLFVKEAVAVNMENITAQSEGGKDGDYSDDDKIIMSPTIWSASHRYTVVLRGKNLDVSGYDIGIGIAPPPPAEYIKAKGALASLDCDDGLCLDCYDGSCIWQYVTDDEEHSPQGEQGACLKTPDKVEMSALVNPVFRGQQTAVRAVPFLDGDKWYDRAAKWGFKYSGGAEFDFAKKLTATGDMLLDDGLFTPNIDHSTDLRLENDPLVEHLIDPDTQPASLGGTIVKLFDVKGGGGTVTVGAKVYTETEEETAYELGEEEPYTLGQLPITVLDWVDLNQHGPKGEKVCRNTQISFTFNQPILASTILDGTWLYTNAKNCPAPLEHTEILMAKAGFWHKLWDFVKNMFLKIVNAVSTVDEIFSKVANKCELRRDYITNGTIEESAGSEAVLRGQIAGNWSVYGSPTRLEIDESGGGFAQKIAIENNDKYGGMESEPMPLNYARFNLTAKIKKVTGKGIVQFLLNDGGKKSLIHTVDVTEMNIGETAVLDASFNFIARFITAKVNDQNPSAKEFFASLPVQEDGYYNGWIITMERTKEQGVILEYKNGGKVTLKEPLSAPPQDSDPIHVQEKENPTLIISGQRETKAPKSVVKGTILDDESQEPDIAFNTSLPQEPDGYYVGWEFTHNATGEKRIIQSYTIDGQVTLNAPLPAAPAKDDEITVSTMPKFIPPPTLEFIVDDVVIQGDYINIYTEGANTRVVLDLNLYEFAGKTFVVALSKDLQSMLKTEILPPQTDGCLVNPEHCFSSILGDSVGVPTEREDTLRVTAPPSFAPQGIQVGDYVWYFTFISKEQELIEGIDKGICKIDYVSMVPPSPSLDQSGNFVVEPDGDYRLRSAEYMVPMNDPSVPLYEIDYIDYRLSDADRTWRVEGIDADQDVIIPIDNVYDWVWEWEDIKEEDESVVINSLSYTYNNGEPLKDSDEDGEPDKDIVKLALGELKEIIPAEKVPFEETADTPIYTAIEGQETLKVTAHTVDFTKKTPGITYTLKDDGLYDDEGITLVGSFDSALPAWPEDIVYNPVINTEDIEVLVCYKIWAFADGQKESPYFIGQSHDYWYNNPKLNFSTHYCIQETEDSSIKDGTLLPILAGVVVDDTVDLEPFSIPPTYKGGVLLQDKILDDGTSVVRGRPAYIDQELAEGDIQGLNIVTNYSFKFDRFNLQEFPDKFIGLDEYYGPTIRVSVYDNPDHESILTYVPSASKGEDLNNYETARKDGLYYINVVNSENPGTFLVPVSFEEEKITNEIFVISLSLEGDIIDLDKRKDVAPEFSNVFNEFLDNLAFNINLEGNVPGSEYPNSMDVPFSVAIGRDYQRILDLKDMIKTITRSDNNRYPLLWDVGPLNPQGVAASTWFNDDIIQTWDILGIESIADPINEFNCSKELGYDLLCDKWKKQDVILQMRNNTDSVIRRSQYRCTEHSYVYHYETGDDCYAKTRAECNASAGAEEHCAWVCSPDDNECETGKSYEFKPLCYPAFKEASLSSYRLYMNFEYPPNGWCRAYDDNKSSCLSLPFCEYSDDTATCSLKEVSADDQPLCADNLGESIDMTFDVIYNSK